MKVFRRCRTKKGCYITAFLFTFLFLGNGAVAAAAPLNVLTSFLPIYIFTKNVVGDREGVTVDLLIPGEAGPHDYHLRPSDMRRIEKADIVITNGLGLESFLAGALKRPQASAENLPLIEDRWSHEDHDDHHGHGSTYNPHTWVSPKMAAMQVENIINILSKADPSGAGDYRRNGTAYVEKLNHLHDQMAEAMGRVTHKKIVTFHNAFDYLARDTGLEIADVIYKASEDELAAGEMVKIISLIKKQKIRAIFSEPQYSSRMAELLARESGAKVYLLDPVATGKKERDYYERVMKKNLETLREALQ